MQYKRRNIKTDDEKPQPSTEEYKANTFGVNSLENETTE